MDSTLENFSWYLSSLFDYQRFEGNLHVMKVINSVEAEMNWSSVADKSSKLQTNRLNDSDLDMLSAAGTGENQIPPKL